jgi:hypothetical protein
VDGEAPVNQSLSMIGDGATGKRKQDERALVVRCTECDRSSGTRWWGWRAYRTDAYAMFGLAFDEPSLAFYCPDCGEREFG